MQKVFQLGTLKIGSLDLVVLTPQIRLKTRKGKKEQIIPIVYLSEEMVNISGMFIIILLPSQSFPSETLLRNVRSRFGGAPKCSPEDSFLYIFVCAVGFTELFFPDENVSQECYGVSLFLSIK